jgi:HAD superfamily hydrolase (TIGR01509 family)
MKAAHPPDPVVAALFDFDETMIDLERQHDAAHRALCRDMGSDYDAMPENFRFGSGRRIVDDIRDMRAQFGWNESDEALNAIRHRYFLDECRSAELKLMAGVERAVRGLHAHGVRLAVTSSAAGDAIDEILRRFRLRDLFETIVDGTEVTHGKPDPEAYVVTARKLGVEPGHCIVFEDSEAGVRAAKAAGMFCLAVRNRRARTLQNLAGADVILQSLEEFDPASVSSPTERSGPLRAG